jgi:hypothetical protein
MNGTRKVKIECTGANILEVCLEHNGYKGGDSGHGGYTKVTFKNITSTMMTLNGDEVNTFEIKFEGDSERETFIEGIEFVLNELNKYS